MDKDIDKLLEELYAKAEEEFLNRDKYDGICVSYLVIDWLGGRKEFNCGSAMFKQEVAECIKELKSSGVEFLISKRSTTIEYLHGYKY